MDQSARAIGDVEHFDFVAQCQNIKLISEKLCDAFRLSGRCSNQLSYRPRYDSQ
jgi:hypothetical protein